VVRRETRIKRSTLMSGLEMLGISSCQNRFRRLSPPNSLTSPISLQCSLAVNSIAKSFQVKPVFSDRGVNPTLDTRFYSSPTSSAACFPFLPMVSPYYSPPLDFAEWSSLSLLLLLARALLEDKLLLTFLRAHHAAQKRSRPAQEGKAVCG
jgi:hypothetical protein